MFRININIYQHINNNNNNNNNNNYILIIIIINNKIKLNFIEIFGAKSVFTS